MQLAAYKTLVGELEEAGRNVWLTETVHTEAIRKRNKVIEKALKAGMTERNIARLVGLESRTVVNKIRREMEGSHG